MSGVLGLILNALCGMSWFIGDTDHHELDEHGESVGLHVHAGGVSEVIV